MEEKKIKINWVPAVARTRLVAPRQLLHFLASLYPEIFFPNSEGRQHQFPGFDNIL